MKYERNWKKGFIDMLCIHFKIYFVQGNPCTSSSSNSINLKTEISIYTCLVSKEYIYYIKHTALF